jgi:hypothetical protein
LPNKVTCFTKIKAEVSFGELDPWRLITVEEDMAAILFRKYSNRICLRYSRKVFFLALSIIMNALCFVNTSIVDAAALRRPISNTNPLFIIRESPQKIMNYIPTELQPYIALELYSNVTVTTAGSYFDGLLKACDSLKIFACVQVWNGSTATTIDTGWVASMFQKHPYFIGTMFAEMHGSHYDFVSNCLNIGSRYGGYTINDDYLNGENPALVNHSSPAMLAATRAHPDNYIYVNKQTTMQAYHKGEGIAVGLWTCGLAGNWGVNPDSWVWCETGRGKLFGKEAGWRAFENDHARVTHPEAEFSMIMYQAALAGATVFTTFENPDYLVVSWGGKPTPCFKKELLPTMKKIVSARLIPTRDQVRSKIKVAWLAPDYNPYSVITNFKYLYEDGTNKDWLRTTGRYGINPLLISALNTAEKSFYPNILNPRNVSTLFPTRASQETYFNNLYPSEYTGSAYAESFFTNKWYLHNSLENTDSTQTATIIPKINQATSIGFTLPAITYALVEEESGGLNVRLGNYCVNKDTIWNDSSINVNNWLGNGYITNPNESFKRTTVITIKGYNGSVKPALSIAGVDGYTGFTYSDAWDGTTKTYTLNVTHNGVVDLSIGTVTVGVEQPKPARLERIKSHFSNHALIVDLPKSSSASQRFSVELLDLQGRKVRMDSGVFPLSAENRITIDCTTLRKGTYLSRINVGQEQVTGEIVIY